MISEEVSSLLLSLGGSAAILIAFAKVLERILIDQVSQRTTASLNQELENLKSQHTNALENFKAKATSSLKEREFFGTISIDTYQDFFKKRIKVYLELLNWVNNYTEEMLENFLTEETDSYADRYFEAYQKLRNIMIKNQLYISNELDKKFQLLRSEAAKYTKKAECHETISEANGANPQYYLQEISEIYLALVTNTGSLMQDILDQIDSDVSKIRSRIEIDNEEQQC